MILQALDAKGGVEYLARQADENPTAFLTLIGKVLPLQVTGENGGPIAYRDVTEDIAAVNSMLGELSRRIERPSLQ